MRRKIFISYRRSDTQMTAGRLYDALVREFGLASVFRDKEAIRPGYDWSDEIQRVLSRDVVVLALIGPEWTRSQDAQGRRRLDDPHDSNRIEIETAFEKKVPVIPLLVEGATIPAADELPPSLVPLIRRHAVRLRDDDWDADFSRLARALRPLGVTPSGFSWRPMDWPKGVRTAGGGGLAAAVLVGAGIWTASFVRSDNCDVTRRLPLRAYWAVQRSDNATFATPDSEAAAREAGYTLSSDEGFVFECEQPETVPLKLFFNGTDYFTTATTEGEHSAQSALGAGYREVKVEGWIYARPRAEYTVPLNLFYSVERRDYFTTTAPAVYWPGYRLVRAEGHVFPK